MRGRENLAMRYETDKFTIETWRDMENEKEDIEFHVYFNGRKYFGWAFTLDAIDKCMKKDMETGESCNGTYFWSTGMIIVKKIDIENLKDTISDLVAFNQDSLEDVFCEIMNIDLMKYHDAEIYCVGMDKSSKNLDISVELENGHKESISFINPFY